MTRDSGHALRSAPAPAEGSAASAGRVRALVFPCGSEIGLEVHRALERSTHVQLVGLSSVPSNHGRYVYREYLEGVPMVDAPDFLGALNAVLEEHRIDLVIPAHDSVVLALAENAGILHCPVVGSPVETCRIARSKRITYEMLGARMRVPRVFRSAAEVGSSFPVFLKPDVGQGSRGTSLAFRPDEVEVALRRDPSLLILEYLPGREFTVDCFTDRHGELRFVGPRERVRTQNGISVHTRPATGPSFEALARTIHEALPFRGAWFFQVKEAENGELALLEIAPRVAGSMALYRNAGVNLPMLGVFDALGIDVEVPPLRHALEMDRALANRFRSDVEYDHVYIDLDDCLLVEGRVNTQAVAFLYQCVNRGIPVHLVTRHRGRLEETLRRHRLHGLFDSITHCDSKQPKWVCIRPDRAIFIDDSFAEREAVHSARGIATFAPDQLESLIDWRYG